MSKDKDRIRKALRSLGYDGGYLQTAMFTRPESVSPADHKTNLRNLIVDALQSYQEKQ